MTNWGAALWSVDAPALPIAALLPGYLHVAWALVALALAAQWSARVAPRWPLGVALLLAVWVAWPATWSAAYWLGLAFQAPSLSSVVLCLGALVQRVGGGAAAPSPDARWRWVWLLVMMAVGWVLLLDLFAVWPTSVYAWGYSPLAVAGAASLLAVLWAAAGPAVRRPAAILAIVLGLFVVTRWPTGNLWDALLDPWLWVAVHYLGLREVWVAFSVRWRARAATRA